MTTLSAFRLLLLDDDPNALAALRRVAERLGHQVDARSSPEHALAAVRAGGFDAVLCEMSVTTYDPIDFIVASRAQSPDVPVVVTARDPEVADVVEIWRRGIADLLKQPVSGYALRECLARVCGERPAALPAEATGRSDDEVQGERRAVLRTRFTGDKVELPVSARLLARVASLVEQRDPAPEEVFRLLESESTLGVAVMHASRSAALGGRTAPASVREAAARLGAVRALSVAATALQRESYRFADAALDRFACELWATHLLTAVVAEAIGRELGVDRPDRLHSMVLFMQVGELLVVRGCADAWPDAFDAGRPTSITRALVRDVSGQAGASFLRRWRLPKAYAELALRFDRQDLAEPGASPLRPVLAMARAARTAVDEILGRDPFDHRQRASPADYHEVPVDAAHYADAARAAVAHVRDLLP